MYAPPRFRLYVLKPEEDVTSQSAQVGRLQTEKKEEHKKVLEQERNASTDQTAPNKDFQ